MTAGRALRPRRLRRRCPAPLPRVAGPGSRTRLDLRFLVAGPGFEPGKTVVGDFTDRGRYRPDLGERQRNALLWRAFDTTTRQALYSCAGFLRRRGRPRGRTRAHRAATGNETGHRVGGEG